MKIKIKKKEIVVDENAMAGSAVGGFSGPAFVDQEKKELIEMYSTRGIYATGGPKSVTAEEEFAGAKEKADHQGLQNYKEQMGEDDELDTMDMDSVDREFFDDFLLKITDFFVDNKENNIWLVENHMAL